MTEKHPQSIALADLLDQCGAGGPGNPVALPQSWTQGRTAFGGLSGAIAYHAASHIETGLPPLRSAQIAFTGPLFGALTAETTMLRRGKNTAFVQSEIFGDKGLGLHCNFIFAAPRPTDVRTYDIDEPDFPPLPGDADLHSGPPQYFTSNMEYVGKRIDTSIKTNRLTRWMRLKQRAGLDPMAEILCMCDSLPPSVMGLLDKNAMVSSMNWQVNIIAEELTTQDGWWLIDSRTHHADHGASSQYMSIWNSRRELIATAMQSVAYYA
ncbi:thioesterase family protein [Sphingorhabdus sp. SMR4y]|uniref:thioesterase family protein n=1 Tax=Sphingorhabdus sp. SMR4y TaxID=2584094 RepID=UPI000B5CCA72|nr:thioesterase family protein [Sphingorhabdus sp. SMR4y]ASK89365.1 thioesterase-like superfamily protein [Sphingorhabdus sp. SMR4y]